jgi:hypothetical protein
MAVVMGGLASGLARAQGTWSGECSNGQQAPIQVRHDLPALNTRFRHDAGPPGWRNGADPRQAPIVDERSRYFPAQALDPRAVRGVPPTFMPATIGYAS